MSATTSPTAGTRTVPIDGLRFVRGTTAVFKITFTSGGVPTKVDTGTQPTAKILEPKFISEGDNPVPRAIAIINGTQVPGQEFEYQFEWDIPFDQTPLDTYIISYEATIGGITNTFGDEFFEVSAFQDTVGIKQNFFATVDDVRKNKFNIDSYLPKSLAKDVNKRNELIEEHLRNATNRLREELSLFKARGNSENYRLFTIFYTIWSIMLAAKGEDGSSVSDQTLEFYRTEWERILSQEKREGVLQGVPMGRG